jgi:hypothetical protein
MIPFVTDTAKASMESPTAISIMDNISIALPPFSFQTIETSWFMLRKQKRDYV